MFERFTDEARHVVVLAQEEARSLSHSYIGTEHILLGLLRHEDAQPADAPRPLVSLGVMLPDVRERIVRIVGRGEDESGGQIPFTPRAKKVLELALREALSLGHDWIGPEHILLGITREDEGVASRVLRELDLVAERVRNQVIRQLGDFPRRPRPTAALRVSAPVDPAWVDGLVTVLARLADEIRGQHGREPDLSDLLLTIACAQQLPSGRALRDLGVDLDALWGSLEHARQRLTEEHERLIQRIRDVRTSKEHAITNRRYEEAAKRRDEERELSAQLEAGSDITESVLREVRRRLGLRESRD